LETKLFFHNQKDDEHWRVIPKQFTLNRSAGKPTLYEYNIEMIIVDKADAETLTLSEDKGILDNIKDVIRQIKGYADMATGAINDLVAVVGELRSIIAGIDSLIDSAKNIVKAATDFVDGVTDLINAHLALVKSLIFSFEEMVDAAKSLGPNLMNSFRQLGDALEGLGSYPDKYTKTQDKVIKDALARQELLTNSSQESLKEAAANPPTTIDAFQNLGTAPRPGDIEKAKAITKAGSATPIYASLREQKLQQGDSLASLASKYLGDARLWKQIAVANGLKPPFVTDMEIRDLVKGEPLPGTLGRGQSILIPSYAPPSDAQPIVTTYGVEPEEPYEVHLLGTDFALETTDGGKTYDIPIDVEGGSVDAKLVAGIPNLVQGVRTRLLTEQGHDVLYRYVGVRRIIGLGNGLVDTEAAKFRLSEAVLADPRISGMQDMTFEEGATPDALDVDMSLEVRGFSERAQLQVEVR
jgi:hypothetical protein